MNALFDPESYLGGQMPLDRCTIRTSFPINPLAVTDYALFKSKTGLKVLPAFHIPGKPDYAQLIFPDYDGLALAATKSPGGGRLIATRVDLNPGILFFGHNGRVLREHDCLLAFSRVLDIFRCLLVNERDEIHIIPGIHPRSKACWSSLEIPMQIYDPEGAVLNALGNARHPGIVKPSFKVGRETITFPGTNLEVTFYWKDGEMKRQLKKHGVSVGSHPKIVRGEVSLKGAKLVEYFKGSGRFGMIEDHLRLVSFTSAALRKVHWDVVSKLTGSFNRPADGSEVPMDDRMGRFIGLVAAQGKHSVDELLSLHFGRFHCSPNTRTSIKRGARNELERLSEVTADELFSSEAYLDQPDVRVPALEGMTELLRSIGDIDPRIKEAYWPKVPASTQRV